MVKPSLFQIEILIREYSLSLSTIQGVQFADFHKQVADVSEKTVMVKIP
jgi:hypothetical protein